MPEIDWPPIGVKPSDTLITKLAVDVEILFITFTVPHDILLTPVAVDVVMVLTNDVAEDVIEFITDVVETA